MTFTLLLDLDDTLLDNDMDAFVPAYLGALSAHMAQHSPPRKFAEALMAATGRMMANTRPDRTLEETFNAAFYPSLGLHPEAVREDIETFYRQVFPSLRRVTRPRKAAAPLVRAAVERGWRVVIATNPLFPRTAIEQRLDWAGVPVDEFPYALVTSFETFHFTKATPAYYAEILGKLGWPRDPLLMVGNDPDLDLRPARAAGLPLFWVTASADGAEADSLPVDGRGPLESLLSWVERRPLPALTGRFETPQAALAVLRAAPALLDGRVRSRPQGDPELAALLSRLRGSDVGLDLPSLQETLRKSGLLPSPVETAPWEDGEPSNAGDLPAAWRAFLETRLRLLGLLESLPAQAFRESARHAVFGSGALGDLLILMAGCERMHLRSLYPLQESAS